MQPNLSKVSARWQLRGCLLALLALLALFGVQLARYTPNRRLTSIAGDKRVCLFAFLAFFGVQLARDGERGHCPIPRCKVSKKEQYPEWGTISITGGRRVVRLPFSPFSLFGRTACERRRVKVLSHTGREAWLESDMWLWKNLKFIFACLLKLRWLFRVCRNIQFSKA